MANKIEEETMTEIQAKYIRLKFQITPGFNKVCDEFPSFEKALGALPDETLMRTTVNVFLLEMFEDAKKEALSK